MGRLTKEGQWCSQEGKIWRARGRAGSRLPHHWSGNPVSSAAGKGQKCGGGTYFSLRLYLRCCCCLSLQANSEPAWGTGKELAQPQQRDGAPVSIFWTCEPRAAHNTLWGLFGCRPHQYLPQTHAPGTLPGLNLLLYPSFTSNGSWYEGTLCRNHILGLKDYV